MAISCTKFSAASAVSEGYYIKVVIMQADHFPLQQEVQGHKAGEEEAKETGEATEVEKAVVAKGEGEEVETAMVAGLTLCATLTSS